MEASESLGTYIWARVFMSFILILLHWQFASSQQQNPCPFHLKDILKHWKRVSFSENIVSENGFSNCMVSLKPCIPERRIIKCIRVRVHSPLHIKCKSRAIETGQNRITYRTLSNGLPSLRDCSWQCICNRRNLCLLFPLWSEPWSHWRNSRPRSCCTSRKGWGSALSAASSWRAGARRTPRTAERSESLSPPPHRAGWSGCWAQLGRERRG